jgi:hypothetical protein
MIQILLRISAESPEANQVKRVEQVRTLNSGGKRNDPPSNLLMWHQTKLATRIRRVKPTPSKTECAQCSMQRGVQPCHICETHHGASFDTIWIAFQMGLSRFYHFHLLCRIGCNHKPTARPVYAKLSCEYHPPIYDLAQTLADSSTLLIFFPIRRSYEVAHH